MSIPLDCLYHYLESLCNDDIIIYRWEPHGSKKLEDLRPLLASLLPSDATPAQTLIKFQTTPVMICHDQEPLFYNYYSESDFIELFRQEMRYTAYPADVLALIAARHLRASTNPHNVYNYVLLCHSEKNSSELALYENNYFIGVYYWSHALISLDWFRFAKNDKRLDVDTKSFKYDFLIYNRAWTGTREYRLKFAELLIKHKITDSCNTSFNPVDNDIHYTDYIFKNTAFNLQNKNIENTLTHNTTPSWASADYNPTDYAQSAIEVILETLFDDTRNHLTEKTLRPIACGKPFILASTAGSLAYLREYGFKTFNGLINEDYDSIIDPLERLQFIVTELERLSNLPHNEKLLLWQNLYKIAEYNKKHFFSQNFHDVVVNEFKDNLTNGLLKCNQHIGKWWEDFKKFNTTWPEEMITEIDKFVALHNINV